MNQRDKMMFLLGQLEAIQFPLLPLEWKKIQGHYDLIDSIVEQYTAILKEIYPDFEDD